MPPAQPQSQRGPEIVRGPTSRPAVTAKVPDYTVEEMNAGRFNKVKRHEIPVMQANGKVQMKKFTFEPGKPLALPRDIAMLFLDISTAFRVRNSEGAIVRPKRLLMNGSRSVTLKPTEVAVDVKYVLKAYLYEMALGMPGGAERFKGGDGAYERSELEEFIITGGKVEEDAEGNLIDTVAA